MKKEVVIIALLLVVTVLLVLFPRSESRELTDAKKFIEEHLRAKYPDADVIEVAPFDGGYGPGGYLNLKARITRELSSPCPERIHEYFNVSVQNIRNFVTAPPEYITRGCRICVDQPRCIIAFEEEAIIASHTNTGTDAVRRYLADYPDATPAVPVQFLNDFNGYGEAWNVTWSSPSAPFTYYAVILKNENRVMETGMAEKG